VLSLFTSLALGAEGADPVTNRAAVGAPMAGRPANLAWRKEAGMIALIGGDQAVWQFNYQSGQDRLFFHPVAVAGGPVLTSDRPKDHPWHRALWFSWKFINGVNYWEPNAQTGTLDGRTKWSNLQSETRPDFSARLSMEIAYRPADGPPVLKEHRVIAISAPAQDGSYSMDWQMTFTALDKAIVFDRTPLPGEPEGKPWGGYAGLSVRFAENLPNSKPPAPRARSGSRTTPIAFGLRPWTAQAPSKGARAASRFSTIRGILPLRRRGI
jgi:hypothetical protein